MGMTLTILLLLCVAAAIIPLVAMRNYDIEAETHAKEIVGRAPNAEHSNSPLAQTFEAVSQPSNGSTRWLVLLGKPSVAFALGIGATILTTDIGNKLATSGYIALERVFRHTSFKDPRLDEIERLIEERLANMRRLEQELLAIQKAADQQAALRELSKLIEVRRTKLQARVKSPSRDGTRCSGELFEQVCRDAP